MTKQNFFFVLKLHLVTLILLVVLVLITKKGVKMFFFRFLKPFLINKVKQKKHWTKSFNRYFLSKIYLSFNSINCVLENPKSNLNNNNRPYTSYSSSTLFSRPNTQCRLDVENVCNFFLILSFRLLFFLKLNNYILLSIFF